LHPARRVVYALSEVADGEGGAGSVTAFAFDADAVRLEPLGSVSSGGAAPAHLCVDPSGRCVLVANYGGGSVAVLPIQADGGLGAASDLRQSSLDGAPPP